MNVWITAPAQNYPTAVTYLEIFHAAVERDLLEMEHTVLVSNLVTYILRE